MDISGAPNNVQNYAPFNLQSYKWQSPAWKLDYDNRFYLVLKREENNNPTMDLFQAKNMQ
jgi:hypothetical protein